MSVLDQKTLAESLRGKLVRFAHERDGGPVHRVTEVNRDNMVWLHDMAGAFGPHLFAVADDIGGIPEGPQAPTHESKASARALTTRRGQPVEIYKIDVGGTYPILGAIFFGDAAVWESFHWTADGRLLSHAPIDYCCPSDLILSNNPDAPREEVAAAIREAVETPRDYAELKAERDKLHEYALAASQAFGNLIGGGSEMFTRRIYGPDGAEFFPLDIPFCIKRLRDRFSNACDRADKAERELAGRSALIRSGEAR